MSTHALMPFRLPLGLCTLALGFALPVAAVANARVSESYGKLPLHFEANRGQTHEDVRFLARGAGYSLYLTAGEAVLVLSSAGAETQAAPVALRMALVGANRKPLVGGLDELPGKANYFIGKDQSKWRANVPTYAKVHYQNIYPGINLVYYGNQRQLEYDFVVAPGADPKRIVLGFKGADKVEIDAQGELVLRVGSGEIRQRKPVIYQEIDGARQEIEGGYVLKSGKRVGFHVAAYDRSLPLVIDPVLVYSTYLGAGGGDVGNGIAVDADGNAYVTGSTGSEAFPTSPGAFQPTRKGAGNAFVSKLNPAGSALVYSTFLGGTNDNGPFPQPDAGRAIVVDSAGNVYVTGRAGSPDFPVTGGAFQSTPGGSGDAFVAKLDSTGSTLVYSTRLGGNSSDDASGIAVDADGSAYVTGQTSSTNFPTTAEAFRPVYGGGPSDLFVTKVNAAGSALVYSTYLGGSGEDVQSNGGIAVDIGGNAYVRGGTSSADFPTTAGAFQLIYGGGPFDAFVTKLDAAGSALVYSTYLGGSGDERGLTSTGKIAVDAGGNAYVVGTTTSTDFPTTAEAFQASSSEEACFNFSNPVPCNHGFVTKLNPTGSALAYSTYLGGNSHDSGTGIAVDSTGNAYVTGSTRSTNFPTTPGAFQPLYAGPTHYISLTGGDAFVTKLDPTGSALVYSSYLGGDDNDFGSAIALDTRDNVYLTGYTWSTNFPTTAGAFDTTYASPPPAPGSADGFVAMLRIPTRFEQDAATYRGSWTTHGSESGTFSGGTILASVQPGASATFTFSGTEVTWIGVKCDICGVATVSIDGGAPAVVNTAGPGRSGSLTSEPVFSASGLAPDVTHTIVITATGTTTAPQSLLVGGTYVAVDAFDVTR